MGIANASPAASEWCDHNWSSPNESRIVECAECKMLFLLGGDSHPWAGGRGVPGWFPTEHTARKFLEGLRSGTVRGIHWTDPDE